MLSRRGALALVTILIALPFHARADEFDGLSTNAFRVFARAACYANGQAASAPGSFAWAPNGLGDKPAYPGCDPGSIRDAMMRYPNAPSSQAWELQQLVGRCGANWARNESANWQTLFDLTQVQYDLCGNRRMRRVALRLDDGAVLRGFLALKPGGARRPLIIVRCGLLCNAGDLSHRFLLMHLFDESPFNVLAVANVTGSEFVADNQYVAVGGLHEGMQLGQIARLVARSPLARYVSSYHLASVSLGAQGVLYASYMNRFNLGAGVPPLASALALCPVVDLRPTARRLFTSSWKGQLARRFFFDDVAAVIAVLPGVRTFFPSSQPDEIPDEVANAATAHYAALGAGWAPAPFQNIRIRDRDELWRANRFLDFANQGTSVPTLAFAAANDWIVGSDVNAAPLSRLVPPGGAMNVVVAPRGNHCAFNMAYGWENATEIYRSFFLSHSPELLARKRIRRASFAADWFARGFAIEPGQAFARYEFEAQCGSAGLLLKVWVYDRADACQNPFEGADACSRRRDFLMPFAGFAPAAWAHAPETAAEAQALTRFANANLRLLDAQGRLTLGTDRRPASIEWESFDD